MPTGLLLVQLGSPRSASVVDVKQYLIEFLGDPLVVHPRPLFWKPLLRFWIAPRRAQVSALQYQQMLSDSESVEMPLVSVTRAFSQGVAAHLGSEIPVEFCFQYGSEPTISQAMGSLARQGCRNVLVLPLYPQRSKATTTAACTLVQKSLKHWAEGAVAPELHMHRGAFCSRSFWIDNLAQSMVDALARQALPPTDVVFSFHGYPQARIDAGDPYESDCQCTVEALEANLRSRKDWPRDIEFHTCYQSPFGRGQWLKPSSTQTLQSLGEQQASVMVVCPSFTADNLETLYEVDHELRDLFFTAGGRAWTRILCPNTDPLWVAGFAGWALELMQNLSRD